MKVEEESRRGRWKRKSLVFVKGLSIANVMSNVWVVFENNSKMTTWWGTRKLRRFRDDRTVKLWSNNGYESLDQRNEDQNDKRDREHINTHVTTYWIDWKKSKLTMKTLIYRIYYL